MHPSTKISLVRAKARSLGLTELIEPSTAKGKKFMVTVDGKRVHFGQAGASDFIEHGDEARRQRYLARASKIRDKRGNLTWKRKSSANFWSVHVLW
jgi:hypothetical protein